MGESGGARAALDKGDPVAEGQRDPVLGPVLGPVLAPVLGSVLVLLNAQ